MEALAIWLRLHKLCLGLSADVLTFAGGLLLARDAFRHLKDLREAQLEQAFKQRFPRLSAKMQDPEKDRAAKAERWAWRGLILLSIGFLLEISTRFAE